MDPRFESAACEPQIIDLGRQQSVLTGLRAVQLAARRPGGVGVAPKTVKNGVAGACTCGSKCATKVCPCFGAGQECRPHSKDAPGCHAPKPGAKRPAAFKCCNTAGGLVAKAMHKK